MDYKPDEIAEVLGVSADYIRKQIIETLQAPHRRCENGRILINGKRFNEWLKQQQAARKAAQAKPKLAADEFYCVGCRKPVMPSDFQSVIIKGILSKKAACPTCKRTIYKFICKAEA